MKFLALALLAVGLAGAAVEAYAYNCTTTCTGYGNSRVCQTNCW